MMKFSSSFSWMIQLVCIVKCLRLGEYSIRSGKITMGFISSARLGNWNKNV